LRLCILFPSTHLLQFVTPSHARTPCLIFFNTIFTSIDQETPHPSPFLSPPAGKG
jgi:hypothetical protein